ncbi:MAG: uracil-xanthine permease family protein [Sarcina sp.]
MSVKLEQNKAKDKSKSIFDLNGKPSMKKAIPLSLQHLLAMIVGNVTPAIIVAGAADLSAADKTMLVQCALFIAGLATLMQLYPLRKIGSGLPVIMGVSFAYVPTLTAIGSTYGIKAIFGAQLIGGIAAILVGIFIKPLRKIFTPIVTGTVVFTIGLSLYPTAIKYMAGGVGASDFGSPQNWAIAFITLAVVLYCSQFTKGYFKLASILIGIIVGYAVSFALGKIDFTAVQTASWVQIPKPMHFGIEFVPAAIISMVVIYIVNAVQAVGDFTATTEGGMGREVKDEELSGGIIGNGLASVIAAFFGGLPTATYSQNVGIVAMTKVVSKYVFMLAAMFMLLAGFVPKFGAAITTIPQSVLGGATISVFAMITMTGIKVLIKEELSGRNVIVVGLAVALGMGITQVPDALTAFPDWVNMVFGSSPVVITSIVVIFLNLILPKVSLQQEEEERKSLDN